MASGGVGPSLDHETMRFATLRIHVDLFTHSGDIFTSTCLTRSSDRAILVRLLRSSDESPGEVADCHGKSTVGSSRAWTVGNDFWASFGAESREVRDSLKGKGKGKWGIAFFVANALELGLTLPLSPASNLEVNRHLHLNKLSGVIGVNGH